MKSFLFSQLRERWRNFINEPNIEKFDKDIFLRFPYLNYLENNGFVYAILNNISFEIEHFSANFFDVLGLAQWRMSKLSVTINYCSIDYFASLKTIPSYK